MGYSLSLTGGNKPVYVARSVVVLLSIALSQQTLGQSSLDLRAEASSEASAEYWGLRSTLRFGVETLNLEYMTGRGFSALEQSWRSEGTQFRKSYGDLGVISVNVGPTHGSMEYSAVPKAIMPILHDALFAKILDRAHDLMFTAPDRIQLSLEPEESPTATIQDHIVIDPEGRIYAIGATAVFR